MQGLDRVVPQQLTYPGSHPIRVFNDVGPDGNSNDDIVSHEPEAVEEADVIRMSRVHASPVSFALPKRQLLYGPVAKLLETNLHLLGSC